MKKKILNSIIGIFLVITLMSSVMAVSRPSRPTLTDDLARIDFDFRVPVFPMLSIIGEDTIAVNTRVSQDFELTAPDFPDKDISDLTYSWFFGIWAIMDNSGNVIAQIPKEKDLGNLRTYKGGVYHTFTESGDYYFIPAILEVKQEFKDGEWVVTSEEIIEKEVSKITVIGLPGEPSVSKIGDFFGRIWDWILSWFS